MSKPHNPYYYKLCADTYHWELDCRTNLYPKIGWVSSIVIPHGKEQCNECRSFSATTQDSTVE